MCDLMIAMGDGLSRASERDTPTYRTFGSYFGRTIDGSMRREGSPNAAGAPFIDVGDRHDVTDRKSSKLSWPVSELDKWSDASPGDSPRFHNIRRNTRYTKWPSIQSGPKTIAMIRRPRPLSDGLSRSRQRRPSASHDAPGQST